MNLLISDFDGTLTEHDFYDLVRSHWPPPVGADPWSDYTYGRITHFEALSRIFANIRTTEEELMALVLTMNLSPGLSQSIAHLRTSGWDVIIASAGCEWYIQRLLKQAGVTLQVHANPGTLDSSGSLRLALPESSRFFTQETGIDKLAIVLDALDRADRVAFAGDGRPDFEPSLRVPPERRFARGWLAEELTRRGEKFHRFTTWQEIPKILCQ